MAVDGLKNLIQTSGGFVALLTKDNDESCWVIPSGYVVISVSRGARFLRWGVSGDANDTSRVLLMAEQVLESFPEFKNASNPLGPFAEFLPTV